jgi:hypothetical protein
MPAEDYSALALKSEKKRYTIDLQLPDNLKAPVTKGAAAGTLLVIADNTVIKEIALIAAADVGRIKYGDILKGIWRDL